MFTLSRSQLLTDLYAAYYDARRKKRNKRYQLLFESHLDKHIEQLCDELWHRTYRARPSTCFVIEDPKKREIFAANFRDRIVHHLYYNYVHKLFERTFINDSYSCIKNRGTHFGIKRLEQHIRRESQNYTQPCYVLKIDIRGYFMHISRSLLLSIASDTIKKMSHHKVSKYAPTRWCDLLDIDFILWLTEQIVLLNPITDCHIVGSVSDWDNLPNNKSLFHSSLGCGLPIGNLTSQLFSNVYMNIFDQYAKRTLRLKHYGRYVDDAYVVSCDKERLRSTIPLIRTFLKQQLGLELHEGKLQICDVRHGVLFLGSYLKPWRRYVSNVTLKRMQRKVPLLCQESSPQHALSVVNSYLGVLSHYRSKHIQEELFLHLDTLWKYGRFVKNKRGLKYKLMCQVATIEDNNY